MSTVKEFTLLDIPTVYKSSEQLLQDLIKKLKKTNAKIVTYFGASQDKDENWNATGDELFTDSKVKIKLIHAIN